MEVGLTSRGSRGGGGDFVKLNGAIMAFIGIFFFIPCGEGGARIAYCRACLTMGIKCGVCERQRRKAGTRQMRGLPNRESGQKGGPKNNYYKNYKLEEGKVGLSYVQFPLPHPFLHFANVPEQGDECSRNNSWERSLNSIK